ncbi:MAG: TfoX/Sxy family protein [Anaerolineales bacterium]|jgi:TfoX/Sxy family transcriptional regulator of competence genes
MAHDEKLAQRVRDNLQHHPGYSERKMFGGVGFMLHGNMACGVNGDQLIVRVGKENYQQALENPHTVEFDLTGRPMTGWVSVLPEGLESEAALTDWIRRGIIFALTLPPK